MPRFTGLLVYTGVIVLFYFLGLAVYILIWFTVSLFYPSFILPGPGLVFSKLFVMLGDFSFWKSFLDTFLKLFVGFILSLGIGIPLGFFSGLSKKFYDFVRPTLMFMQATPVVSYISIALLWFGIGFYTPVFICFVVIFPTVVINIAEGVGSTDRNLVMLSRVFRLSKSDVIRYIYIPSIVPFINSTLKVVCGSLWRSVVIGEFMAGNRGLGYLLSLSKSTLRTDEVFANTLFLIIVGIIFEFIVMKINFVPKVNLSFADTPTETVKSSTEHFLELQSISKSFGKEKIIKELSFKVGNSQTTALLGPSGIGKTTVLNIISGTVGQDSGKVVSNHDRIGYVFQDDRLIPWLSVKDNIKIVNRTLDDSQIDKILELLKLKGCGSMMPAELSGGMRKRVNIARAIGYSSTLLLLDEPFGSVDIKTRYDIMLDLLNLKKETGISIILVSHDPFETSLMADQVVMLEGRPAEIVYRQEYKNSLERSKQENNTIMNDLTYRIINHTKGENRNDKGSEHYF